MMKVGVISLFPEMFKSVTDFGITGRAVKEGLLSVSSWNPRDFTDDNHHTVDDRPYGGGPGMIMMAEPLSDAIKAAKTDLATARVIYLSPQGRKLDQAGLQELAEQESMILVSGRYEGVDERLIQAEVDEEWSIGDYVLSGGELASMVLIDAITRTLPGALRHEESASQDSFFSGLLDCPHFTRPENWQDKKVPDVLLSGNHEAIRRWRLKQSLGRTWQRRPDLLNNLQLNEEQKNLLNEFKNESN